jgi:hypothetical protein
MTCTTLIAASPVNLLAQILRVMDEQDGLVTVVRPDSPNPYTLTAAGFTEGSYVIAEKITSTDKTMGIDIYPASKLAAWLADFQPSTWKVTATIRA